ncbi:MAG: MATE family efflux transporter [Clostridia bacterium]|nr:MATE family efflux transporter [Clostridia bacterium]
MEKVKKQKPKYTLFTGKALLFLILPIVIEQIFSTSLGVFDGMMVSSIGSSAGNAVSNVDDINNLIIQLFAAFATGGVIVTSQFIGAKKIDEANRSAKQVVVLVVLVALALCVLCLALNGPLLSLFFSKKNVGEETFRYQKQYFYITAASFPFIGLFNVNAALLRAQRKSRVTMISAGISLVVNVGLNALFIYVFNWEVIGAAAATLISRIVPAAYTTYLITRKDRLVHIKIFEKFRFDGKLVRRILAIAVPAGIENCLFQLGKVFTSSFVNNGYYYGVTVDGANIEANANSIAKSLNNYASVVGGGVGTSVLTVIGQAVGAGDPEQVKYYMKRMFLIGYIANAVAVAVIMGCARPMAYNMYGYADEAKELAVQLLYFCLSIQFVTYPLSFITPNILKATSDARYVMWGAIASMLIVRVGLCWFLVSWNKGPHLGAFGYWIAMCSDWVVRSIIFLSRLLSGRWRKKSGLLKDAEPEKALAEGEEGSEPGLNGEVTVVLPETDGNVPADAGEVFAEDAGEDRGGGNSERGPAVDERGPGITDEYDGEDLNVAETTEPHICEKKHVEEKKTYTVLRFTARPGDKEKDG